MTQAAIRHLYSADDLLAMEDGDVYELDDGELVEVPVGAESQWVAGRLFARLSNYIEEHPIGLMFPMEVGLQMFPDRPQRIPRSDGAFVAKGRLEGDRPPRGFLTIPPDLLIEAISPRESAGAVERKIEEYLSAGVRLVWVLWPETRTAMVRRRDGSASDIRADGYLDGEDVLPGFRCALVDIMPPADDPSN